MVASAGSEDPLLSAPPACCHRERKTEGIQFYWRNTKGDWPNQSLLVHSGKLYCCDILPSPRCDGFTLPLLQGQVASLLSKADSASPRSTGIVPRHIPYRDSTLTKLLMDCLGGDSMALFVCCVSPSNVYVEETLNTLNFGSRARNMRNKPTKHVSIQPLIGACCCGMAHWSSPGADRLTLTRN